jgi:hypothetical protein
MVALAMVLSHRHRVGAARRWVVTLALLSSVGLCVACSPRLRSLSFLYDPYFFAISGDSFSSLRAAAHGAGFSLAPIEIPDSELSSGFFAAIDKTHDRVIAVSPLFSREAVSALAKYPDRTFVFVDEVAALESGPRLRVPRFSRASALREAGGLCARLLAASSHTGARSLAMLVPSSDDTVVLPDEAAFLAGFRAVSPDGLVVRYPIEVSGDPGIVLPFAGNPQGTRDTSSLPHAEDKPALAVVLLGADSPVWAAKLSEKGIPYVTEGGIRRASFDNALVASIETDTTAGFRAELDAVRDGLPAAHPVQAELLRTGAAAKTVDAPQK